MKNLNFDGEKLSKEQMKNVAGGFDKETGGCNPACPIGWSCVSHPDIWTGDTLYTCMEDDPFH